MRILHAMTGAAAALLAGSAVCTAFAGEPTNNSYNPPVEYQILGGGERSPATGFPPMGTTPKSTTPKNGVDGSHLGPQANSYGKNGVDGSHQGALTAAAPSHAVSAGGGAFSGHPGGMGHGHGGGGAK